MKRLLCIPLLATLAFAADPFYFGTWKITSAAVAPWAPKDRKPDPAEMRGLVGKTLTISASGIQGPREVGCKGPKYTIKEYPADMLFEGAFGEMHEKDKSADPAKIAAGLGFQGKKWKTLETGCEIEISYHFVDEKTAEFGLNDYVYTLKKQ